MLWSVKHVWIFYGVIWYIQQKVVQCYFILLPQVSYIYWLIHFNIHFLIFFVFLITCFYDFFLTWFIYGPNVSWRCSVGQGNFLFFKQTPFKSENSFVQLLIPLVNSQYIPGLLITLQNFQGMQLNFY